MTELPFDPTAFDTTVCVPLSSRWQVRCDTEAEAVDAARGQVGPNQTQVSITAHSADASKTFAMRHFTWEHGEVVDSGWRCWVGGIFVGGVAP